MKFLRVTLLVAVPGLLLAACAEPEGETADAVYRNGAVYTVDGQGSWAQAVAIKDGKFLRVGSDEEVAGLIGEGTQVIDLEGRMAMPGLHDTHIHPVRGAVQQLFSCRFPFSATPREVAGKIRQCAAEQTDQEWIVGGQWSTSMTNMAPQFKAMLDAAVPDRPVFLLDATYHHGWANAKALELAGITSDTPDPEGGTIDRDPHTGEPTGALLESAKALVGSIIPATTPGQYAAAAKWITETLNRDGITSIKAASTTPGALGALRDLDQAGGLSLRVAVSLPWRSNASPLSEQDALIRNRADFRSAHVNPDFIKIMLDGVPPTHTAAYIEPYADRPGYRGQILVAQGDLDADVIRFDKAGLTVKFHVAGDAATRAALDAIAAARQANGRSGLRHETGHSSLVHADDRSRHASLGAIAEMSPILWYPSRFFELLHGSVLGPERTEKLWPVRSLVASGALVVAGSDWPAAVLTANPWPAIEAMVTRRNPYGEYDGTLGAGEAVDLETAIRIYTRNAAYSLRNEAVTGSIEEDKFADMIVLDRNIFEIPPEDIDGTKVLITVFEGKVVHER